MVRLDCLAIPSVTCSRSLSSVLEALGDWRKCTFRDAGNLLKVVRNPDRQSAVLEVAERLINGDPQLSFNVRMKMLLGQTQAEPANNDLRDDSGRVLAARRQNSRSTAITFSVSADAGLANYVWGRLPALVEEFRRERALG